MGSAVSLECWDTGSIPSLAQWVKDLALPQLTYVMGQPKKREKKNEISVRPKIIFWSDHSNSYQNSVPGSAILVVWDEGEYF